MMVGGGVMKVKALAGEQVLKTETKGRYLDQPSLIDDRQQVQN
jgi:hypothetical protein